MACHHNVNFLTKCMLPSKGKSVLRITDNPMQLSVLNRVFQKGEKGRERTTFLCIFLMLNFSTITPTYKSNKLNCESLNDGNAVEKVLNGKSRTKGERTLSGGIFLWFAKDL